MANTKITSRVIADNAVTTSAIADDAITSAKLDTNISVAGTLTVTGDGGSGMLLVNTTSSWAGETTPHIESRGDVAGDYTGLIVSNTNDAASDSVSVNFGLARDGGYVFGNAGKITVGKEQDWSGVPSTVDGFMSFSTMQNESLTERMSIASSGDVTMSGTGALTIPKGTTAQRPTGATGMMRYNTSTSNVEAYIGSAWEAFATAFSAVGGSESTVTINSVNYKIHAFTTSGTFQVQSGFKAVDILVVAGGGGGGGSTAGGGGAGGLIYQAGVGAAVGSYTITIGAGGAGSRRADLGSANNTNGANTTAFGYTAIGGGYGYSGAQTGSRLPNSGGSGGGGGGYSGNDIATSSGAAGTSGQGNAGGDGNDPGNWGGAGGGGATAVGADQNGTRAGGAGSDQSGTFGTSLGESGVFAGGGGGGAFNSGVTQGGTGGGGNGGDGQTHTATAGSANTGGGGGGGGYYQYGPGGGAGGSGIVLIRYVI